MTQSALTIAFVDLAGYTALTEAHGDEDAASCAARFYELARQALVGETRVVKRIGDAVMLVGSNPSDCAATVLELFAKADAEADFPGLRAGLSSGPAVERDGDYFGATVNLAARIGAHARSGEILCDEPVARALGSDPRVRVVELGAVAFKNVAQPVPVFSLASAAPASGAAVDPVCRMRIAQARVTVEHAGRVYSFCSDACAERFRTSPESFAR